MEKSLSCVYNGLSILLTITRSPVARGGAGKGDVPDEGVFGEEGGEHAHSAIYRIPRKFSLTETILLLHQKILHGFFYIRLTV